MTSVFERVINWNEKRYERIFNFGLANALLVEEAGELENARIIGNPIETLDAVGDITFVAIGILWKLGYSPEYIESLFEKHISKHKKPNVDIFQASLLSSYVDIADYSKLDYEIIILRKIAHLICISCVEALKDLDMFSYYLVVLRIICDSNDTKAIEKVLPDIKANINKGANYKAPTEDLESLFYQVKGLA
ncbi:MAG: hypothetical protein COV55_02830 [Candidatus Komeilibacteria bacterium CG11_big_fil_rev_8_21_14_0_20_36_20]|uniref:Uncharacterized protein n=1 Tax=Candidatus Komeilibacteria bacterium CG11_big_fil_rev_8_21_14_0_20_36_20 TaxID=1974477 RepID=A0A2H0NER1_9BACT|nr:MAG: hypothetical protein COV55_02830 [Candidatus Komeilibacteria bacterium CG11_big_fil_rev_8_21_14_0_20_36_20]